MKVVGLCLSDFGRNELEDNEKKIISDTETNNNFVKSNNTEV